LRNLGVPRAFSALLRQACRSDWIVYAKRPFGGPDHVLQYLGNYTHRIVISNRRLVALEDGKVSFRWRDSAHKNKKRVMALRVEEFLRRFFLHVLPTGFVRIRHFGLFANRSRKVSLALCRSLLAEAGAPEVGLPVVAEGASFWSCPDCGSTMVLVERLTPAQTWIRPPPGSGVIS
jgi:hypothetical protein